MVRCYSVPGQVCPGQLIKMPDSWWRSKVKVTFFPRAPSAKEKDMIRIFVIGASAYADCLYGFWYTCDFTVFNEFFCIHYFFIDIWQRIRMDDEIFLFIQNNHISCSWLAYKCFSLENFIESITQCVRSGKTLVRERKGFHKILSIILLYFELGIKEIDREVL